MLLSETQRKAIAHALSGYYRIDIQALHLYFFGASVFVMIGGIFYLGVLIGLGARQIPQSLPTAAQPVQEEVIDLKQLVINQGLPTPKTSPLSSQTRRSGNPVQIDPPTPPKPKIRSPKSAVAPAAASSASASTTLATPKQGNAPAAAQALEAQSIKEPTTELTYSVQVFSSQRRAAAQSLTTELDRAGFSAYIDTFTTAQGVVWHRVRVGKTTKDGAEALAQKLRGAVGITNMQVVQTAP